VPKRTQTLVDTLLENVVLIDTWTIIIPKDRRSFERLMEILHRKEHETSATIAEAGGLAVRIILISAPSEWL
jgi:hypothetical protein